MSFSSAQVVQPGWAWVLPRRSVDTIALYDSGDSSLPDPMPAAVAARSAMFVVWIAPLVMVHDGFQKVDSSKNGVPGGIFSAARRSAVNACNTGAGISGVKELAVLSRPSGSRTLSANSFGIA